jgi:predicted GIY-YIG superfamily endonuclease
MLAQVWLEPVGVDSSIDGSIRADRTGVDQAKRFVYVLRSDRDPSRHYVGLTSDVGNRLRWHNAGQNRSTARDRPWTVLVAIGFRTEDAAVQFERYLKSGSGRAFAKRHFP